MLYFTSDLHLGHERIIKYCNRPWETVHKMNRGIIDGWNSRVTADDTVYVLGDFTMYGHNHSELICSWLSALNGEKHLILGNHDRLKPRTYVDIGFQSVHTSLQVGEYVLVHDPASAVALSADQNILCGHVHDTFQFVNGILNVGVDVHDYKPVSYMEVGDVFYQANQKRAMEGY